MTAAENKHCTFREEDGICAIRSATDAKPIKPVCLDPEASTETCKIAIDWQSLPTDPINLGFEQPMGEIN